MNEWKNKNFFEALKNALNGLKYAIKTQKDLKIQIFIAIIVIIISILLKISKIEMIIITISIFLVIFAEVMNTAIEKTVDLVTQEYNEIAKIAKDVSAGAVLILAINSIIIGLYIFGDKIINIIK